MNNEAVSGYLKKLKSSSLARVFGGTNLRWFEYDPELRKFGYKEYPKDKEFIGYFMIKEIDDYNENLTEEEKSCCEWIYGFKVHSSKRTYILFSQTENERIKWKTLFNTMLNRIKKTVKSVNKEVLNLKPVIDIQEVLRKKKLKEQEEERRRREQEYERKCIERQRERNEKKGFYDDLAVTLEDFNKNVDNYKKPIDLKKNLKQPTKKYSNEDEKVILMKDKIDDWNYYQVGGNKFDIENTLIKPSFLSRSVNSKPLIIKETILDHEKFKKNYPKESLLEDNYALESKRKFLEDEIKRKEQEDQRLIEQEQSKRKEEANLHKEIEIDESLLKGVEKIKYELEKKKTLLKKYSPNLNIEKGLLFNIYHDNELKKTNTYDTKLKFDGINLEAPGDPSNGRNILSNQQENNIVKDSLNEHIPNVKSFIQNNFLAVDNKSVYKKSQGSVIANNSIIGDKNNLNKEEKKEIIHNVVVMEGDDDCDDGDFIDF